MTPDHAKLEQLREAFPESEIELLPKGKGTEGSQPSKCHQCGGFHKPGMVHISYVGHAKITDRLLTVDLEWNWKPAEVGGVTVERDSKNQPIGLWIELTVGGVTRLGYGSCDGTGDAMKELIGDAIRNAAMRFGCGLELWIKDHKPEASQPRQPAPKQQPQPAAKEQPKPAEGSEAALREAIKAQVPDHPKVKDGTVMAMSPMKLQALASSIPGFKWPGAEPDFEVGPHYDHWATFADKINLWPEGMLRAIQENDPSVTDLGSLDPESETGRKVMEAFKVKQGVA